MSVRILTTYEEKMAQLIVNAATIVHKELGPGLLENVYETCMTYLLTEQNVNVKRDYSIPIFFQHKKFDEGLKVDLLVDEKVLVDIHAADEKLVTSEQQMISFLKLTGLKFGFVINFNAPLIKNGIKRYVI